MFITMQSSIITCNDGEYGGLTLHKNKDCGVDLNKNYLLSFAGIPHFFSAYCS